jgi:phage terminase large subunit
MQEIRIGLQPKQILFKESIEQKYVTLFGGARGGGKSYSLRNIVLIRRFQFANSIGVIFRKTYPELEANHIRPLFQEHPSLKPYWNEGKKLLTLPNGSTLQFSHASNEKDISLYQGREIHDLGIDEAGQWTEAMFRTLSGSNRSSLPGIKARCALTANPGGPGHKWLKRLFIERRFNERERPDDYAFIQALVDDNPALISNDPDYVHRLESEPNEALRAAYRYGSWDIWAGQFFNEISRDVHFITPIQIPSHWNRFGAYDYGFNHPAAFGWFAVDGDGNVYQYRELIQAGLRVDEFAAQINKHPDTKDLYLIVAGWDCWAKKSVLQTGTTPTIAEEFLKHELVLTKAKIDRVQGAAQLRNYLAYQNLPHGRTKPRLSIFNTCPITFDCLTRMEHDPNHVEDVLKVDAVEGDPMSGDDAYDMLRYACLSRPAISDPPKIHHKPGTEAHSKHFAETLENHAIEKLKKEKANKEGHEMNWETDRDGIPSWNKWE